MDESKFINWKKSRRSSGGDNCVEVSTAADGTVGIRDSKDRDGATLVFGREAWADFAASVRDGEFDTNER